MLVTGLRLAGRPADPSLAYRNRLQLLPAASSAQRAAAQKAVTRARVVL